MTIAYELFSSINLGDNFFDSLKQDYPRFEHWFTKKAHEGERAFTFRSSNGVLGGFVYLKVESGVVDDVTPQLPAANRVKIGTMKIEAHGTKLGERFLKKAIDWAISANADELYVTVLPKHIGLVNLFESYGFRKVAIKDQELVLAKSFDSDSDDLLKSYPSVKLNRNCFLLAVYPEWHTRLFPDSRLITEGPEIVTDVSHTNSIHKVYLCNMPGVENVKQGDVLVIYRTAEEGKVAEYNAVATSICVVEEYRNINSFANKQIFMDYVEPYSVFTGAELDAMWRNRKYPKIIKFTYNVSFAVRPIRKILADVVGLDRTERWGFIALSKGQLKKIAELGGVHAGLVVD